MEKVSSVPGVVATAPFSINPMMLTHGEATATGVLLKGVDPTASLGVDRKPGVPPVLDLPRHIIEGESGTCSAEGDLECGIRQLRGLRRPGAKPAERKIDSSDFDDPFESPKPHSKGATLGLDDDIFRDDAGMPLDLKKQALKDIEKGERRRKELAPDAADWEPVAEREGVDAGASADETIDAGADAPVGNVAPDGGYKSVLPEDDDLPPELSADACADPAQVRTMPGVVVGVSLAKTLNLKIGDCVTVTSPTIGYQWSGGSIKPPVAKSFRVMAIFEAGFDQYDSKLVYTDLYEAQSFYDQGDTVTGVEMKIADIDQADDVVKGVTNALASKSYHIMDWKELNHGLFTALLIQQIGMSAVLALIILVAAFTVVATLIMVVLDKKREIAVLKAMGATDSAILRVFLYQGGIIGFLGTSIGLSVGLVVCKGLIRYGFPLDPKVYFISHLPVLVRPFEFLVTGGVALVLCLTATILPSLYAAAIRPADGFREQ